MTSGLHTQMHTCACIPYRWTYTHIHTHAHIHMCMYTHMCKLGVKRELLVLHSGVTPLQACHRQRMGDSLACGGAWQGQSGALSTRYLKC